MRMLILSTLVLGAASVAFAISPVKAQSCPPGMSKGESGVCIPDQPCLNGYHRQMDGSCKQ